MNEYALSQLCQAEDRRGVPLRGVCQTRPGNPRMTKVSTKHIGVQDSKPSTSQPELVALGHAHKRIINKTPSFQVFNHTRWETRQTPANAETPENTIESVGAQQHERRGQIKTNKGQIDMILHQVCALHAGIPGSQSASWRIGSKLNS